MKKILFKFKEKGFPVQKMNGFTLIEVMIALVVLLFGTLGVMAMQYMAVSGNAASRELRVATTLSQTKIEDIKATPYTSITSGTDTPQTASTLTGGITFTRRWWVVANCVDLSLSGDDGTCSGSITASCSTTLNNASAIRVRTCWTDSGGNNHSVTLDTVRWNESATP